jgi:hypothetical protein
LVLSLQDVIEITASLDGCIEVHSVATTVQPLKLIPDWGHVWLGNVAGKLPSTQNFTKRAPVLIKGQLVVTSFSVRAKCSLRD